MTYDMSEIIDLYNSVGPQIRNISNLANWIHEVSSFSYLPGVDYTHKEKLAEDKTKLTIFGVLIDDLADNHKLRDQNNMEKAIRIPWNTDKKYRNEYLEVTKKIWIDINNSIKKYPRYGEFEKLFFFDLNQFSDSVNYSFLVNTLKIDNSLEFKTYSPHNMMSMLFFDMDLMCSSNFKKEKLRKIRPILYWVQDIVHIGNVVSTYSREVRERDFSSPIISLGLRKKLVTKKDIINNPDDSIEKLKSLIPNFKERAKDDFRKIEERGKKIEFMDVKEFSMRVRKAYESFLSRGKYWNE